MPSCPFSIMPIAIIALPTSSSHRYEFQNTVHAVGPRSPSSWGPFHTMKFTWFCDGEYDFGDDSVTTYFLRIASSVPTGRAGAPQLLALNYTLILLCGLQIVTALNELRKSYQVFAYVNTPLFVHAQKLTLTRAKRDCCYIFSCNHHVDDTRRLCALPCEAWSNDCVHCHVRHGQTIVCTAM
jgi:hypothetical protein